MMQGASIFHLARGLHKREFFTTREILGAAWKQAYFRIVGVEDPDHVAKTRASALSFIAGHTVVELEDRRPFLSLRRSGALVRGRWIRVASLVGISAALALVAGPLLGAILIFLTDMPFALLNVVAGVVYAVAMPFVALVTAYVYFDARARMELERVERPSELPAEIQLEPS